MLRFNSTAAERRFLLFIADRPAVSSLAFMLFLLIFDILVVDNLSRPFRGVSDEFDTILAICASTFFVICLICVVAVVLDRCKPGLVATSTLRLVMDLTYGVFVVGFLIAGSATLAESQQLNCEGSGHATFKEGEKAAYREAACKRSLSTIAVFLMSTLVIKRIRFDITAVSSFLGFGATLLSVIVWPRFDPWVLGVATVIVMTGFFVFMCFMRYVAEKREREYFLTQERLETMIADAERSTVELKEFVDRLLPPLLVERSGRRGLVHKIDHANDAGLLVMKLSNLMEFSQTVRPVEAALCIEHFRATTDKLLLGEPSLTRVSVFLDEIVAVGNLLSRNPHAMCIASAAQVAIQIVRESGIDSVVQAKAAIHLGEVRGGFSGNHWVRYDIWGPGVETARSMVQMAGPGETLVSEEVVHAARDLLDVREGPDREAALCGSVENELDGGSEQRLHQYWLLNHCDEYNDEDNDLVTQPSSATHSLTNPSASSTTAPQEKQTPAAQLQHLMTDRTELGRQLGDVTHSKWCIFSEFDDAELEEKYAAQRREGMAVHAAHVWMAYAAFLAVHLVVLVVDLYEPRGVVAVVGMTLATLLAAVSANLAHRYGSPTPPTTSSMLLWSMLSFCVPLLAVYSTAASRPSALGMDLRTILVGSALAQTAGFLPAHRQMVLTILFALVSTLQFFLLPGGVLYTTEMIALMFVVFIGASDAETDGVQRANFLSECRIVDTLNYLKAEEAVRTGLSRAIVPTPILHYLGDLGFTQPMLCTVPDTVVVYVTVKARESVGFGQVEAAVVRSQWLDVVTFNGDSMLLMSPVVSSTAQLVQKKSEISAVGEAAYWADILSFCMALDAADHRVLVQCETTEQLVSFESAMPRYSVMGIGITRTLAIASTADDVRIRSGVLVAEGVRRLLNTVNGLADVAQKELPRWRIRGVGVLRMTELKRAV